jgi:DNA-binding HxlR family transcriptional regulator
MQYLFHLVFVYLYRHKPIYPNFQKDITIPKDTGILWDTPYLCTMNITLEAATESDSRDAAHPCGETACAAGVAGIRDTLYVLNGKWKLPLIFALIEGPKRFKDIQRALGDITPKILSKELKELELNEFVVRTVYSTTPVTVVYELTPYSRSLRKVLDELRDWGIKHRQRIVASRKTTQP